MSSWRVLCAGARDVQVEEGAVKVSLSRDRSQRVHVEEKDGRFELRALVARKHLISDHEQAQLSAWGRNRSSSLVGFRFDAKGHLVGESWVPFAGLTKEEFLLCLRRLAAACDLFEFQLTGKDRE